MSNSLTNSRTNNDGRIAKRDLFQANFGCQENNEVVLLDCIV